MVKKVACPLCDSFDLVLIETIPVKKIKRAYKMKLGVESELNNNYFEYYSCQCCGLFFFHPLETGSENFYEKLQKFNWYYMDEKFEYTLAKKYLPKSGKILEVGAGKAAFSNLIGLNDYVGLEFNDTAIKTAASRGIILLKQSIEEHSRLNQKYDAVLSFQVLEHVKDPKGFINSSIACLKPNGRLIIAVPAHDSFVGLAVNNILNMPPHHVTQWTTTALNKIAEINNLKLIAIEYEPVATYHNSWAKKIIIEAKIREMFKLQKKIFDDSLLGKLLSLASGFLVFILNVNMDKFKGHTVVAVYEKNK